MGTNWKPYAVSFMVILILFPFAYLAVLSMSGEWFFPSVIPGYLGLRNWYDITGSETGLSQSLIVSLLISVTVASLATGSGFVVSKTVAYHKRKGLLTLLTYLPYILSPVVFAACLNFFFLKMGLSGQVSGVILSQFFIAFPYSLLFFLSFWNKRTQNLENLVATLGGSSRQAYVRVLVPMAKGMLLVCFFQTFLISWFEYGLTSIIGVGKVQTLTVKVFLYIKEANFYYGAISCCLLILPPVVLLYFNKKFVFNRLS